MFTQFNVHSVCPWQITNWIFTADRLYPTIAWPLKISLSSLWVVIAAIAGIYFFGHNLTYLSQTTIII